MPSRYETTEDRVVEAILSGAAVGAVIVFCVITWYEYNLYRADSFFQYMLTTGASILGYAFLFWVLAIVLTGGPVWYILHRWGLRQLWCAMLTGGFLPFLVFFILAGINVFNKRAQHFSTDTSESSFGGADSWLFIFQLAWPLGLISMIIGALIWRVAYRKV